MILTIALLLTHCITAQRVLIIGIDGCRADVAELINTPSLDALKANGVYSRDALNDDITVSGPGWSAILCGVWSDKHGVTNNSFSGSNYEEYPSLFKRIEDFDPSLNTVSIAHWDPINNNIVGDDADVVSNVSTDAQLTNEAISQLQNADPHVMFLHYDDVDHAGHAHGFSADIPQYTQSIETTDTYIGQVISALNARPDYIAENWAVLVTSDHGGINFSHGGNTIEEENVMFIASGDQVPTQTVTRDSMLNTDIEPDCLDNTQYLSFDGSQDNVQIAPNSIFDFGPDQDFTIECRVKTNTAADVSIIGNKDWNSGTNKGFVFSFRFANGPEWKVNIGDGANRVDINTGGAIADQNWHTLSVTFDRDGLMTMYEDGTFLSSAPISGISDITTNAGLWIGTDINGSYGYQGAVSEVRVWNSVVSASAISDYACATLDSNHPNTQDLIGYWPMDEGSNATIVTDQSSNANNGTISGATWTTPGTSYIYDYSMTPTIADISVSAFAHLCIPIDTSWSLDGRSWIADCIYNEPRCANVGINRYIGPVTDIWQSESNWSRGFVPLPCDHVVIPDGVAVTILSTKPAICRTLQLQGSASVILSDEASLNVLSED